MLALTYVTRTLSSCSHNVCPERAHQWNRIILTFRVFCVENVENEIIILLLLNHRKLIFHENGITFYTYTFIIETTKLRTRGNTNACSIYEHFWNRWYNKTNNRSLHTQYISPSYLRTRGNTNACRIYEHFWNRWCNKPNNRSLANPIISWCRHTFENTENVGIRVLEITVHAMNTITRSIQIRIQTEIYAWMSSSTWVPQNGITK